MRALRFVLVALGWALCLGAIVGGLAAALVTILERAGAGPLKKICRKPLISVDGNQSAGVGSPRDEKNNPI